MTTTAAVAYYRTLASQSSASLTAGYLTGFIRAAGHPTTLVQLEAGSAAHDMHDVIDAQPDVLFYKVNFKDLPRFAPNLDALLERSPGTTICLFGPYAALNASTLLRSHPALAAVLVTNHEPVASAGVDWLLGDAVGPPQSGFIHRRGGAIVVPPPDAETVEAALTTVGPARDVEAGEPVRFVNMEATRGCLRGCTFCHVPAVTALGGARVIRREPASVVQEMRELHAEGKSYFIFNDSIFGGGTRGGADWIRRFVEELRASRLDVRLMTYFTLNYLQREPELIADLASVGMIRVFVGVESATDVGTRRFRKGIHAADYHAVKRRLLDSHVVPHMGFMLFGPLATLDEIDAGVDFLRESDELHRFGVVSERTRLIPSTRLYDEVAAAGLIHDAESPDVLGNQDYRFADDSTASAYRELRHAIERIDEPLLDRLEHLFVTGLFIDNLVRRDGEPTGGYAWAWRSMQALRAEFGAQLLGLYKSVVGGSAVDPERRSESFHRLWQATEPAWQEQMRAAGTAGIDDPVSWVPSGDLRGEAARLTSPVSARRTARSGAIKVAT
jgi:radical SAM superfamily enzyme YgiQ (UPF0313 family)